MIKNGHTGVWCPDSRAVQNVFVFSNAIREIYIFWNISFCPIFNMLRENVLTAIVHLDFF